MQQALVRDFFDQIALGYNDRYEPQRPFHHYLFAERLRAAQEGLPLEGARVLDVGAGTGPLYEAFTGRGLQVDYHACDVSPAMLAQSRIPAGRYQVGPLESTTYAAERFDYLFALGLTTYLLPEELDRLLNRLPNLLYPGGTAVLSFTYQSGLNWQIRQALAPAARKLRAGGLMLSQKFETRAYTPQEITARMPAPLQLQEIRWLTPCLPLLSRWWPQVGIPLARRLAHPRLYSDFLILIQQP